MNLTVISRGCLVVTGSSLLTFIVLPYCCIKSQLLYLIPQSPYTDTRGISPSRTPKIQVPSGEQLVPSLTEGKLNVHAIGNDGGIFVCQINLHSEVIYERKNFCALDLLMLWLIWLFQKAKVKLFHNFIMLMLNWS